MAPAKYLESYLLRKLWRRSPSSSPRAHAQPGQRAQTARPPRASGSTQPRARWRRYTNTLNSRTFEGFTVGSYAYSSRAGAPLGHHAGAIYLSPQCNGRWHCHWRAAEHNIPSLRRRSEQIGLSPTPSGQIRQRHPSLLPMAMAVGIGRPIQVSSQFGAPSGLP